MAAFILQAQTALLAAGPTRGPCRRSKTLDAFATENDFRAMHEGVMEALMNDGVPSRARLASSAAKNAR